MTVPMERNVRGKRRQAALGASLEKRLLSYSLVAGAALVTARAAQAEILFTPNHTSLTYGTFDIDLNRDGVYDFSVKEQFYRTASSRTGGSLYLKANGLQPSNSVAVAVGYAAALTNNNLVGPNHSFQNEALMARCFDEPEGPWRHALDRSFGVKFLINGEVHYGWIGFRKVQVQCYAVTAQLYGWAYETEPNKPIRAGDMGHSARSSAESSAPVSSEFSALELMAAGHLGVAELRRRPPNGTGSVVPKSRV